MFQENLAKFNEGTRDLATVVTGNVWFYSQQLASK